jgi:hypothetical protein
MDIDRQCVAAVRLLGSLGYASHDDAWAFSAEPPGAVAEPLPFTAEADALHGALMRRADALAGLTENSEEEGELKTNVEALGIAGDPQASRGTRAHPVRSVAGMVCRRRVWRI